MGDKPTDRATSRHLKGYVIEQGLAAVQGCYQKNAFIMSDVSMQSQEAYELAAKGLIRPQPAEEWEDEHANQPLIYQLKVRSNPQGMMMCSHVVSNLFLSAHFLQGLPDGGGDDLRQRD